MPTRKVNARSGKVLSAKTARGISYLPTALTLATVLLLAESSTADANPGGRSSTLCGQCSLEEIIFSYQGQLYSGSAYECDWNGAEGWDQCSANWYYDPEVQEIFTQCAAYNDPEYSVCPGSGDGLGDNTAIHASVLGADGSWLLSVLSEEDAVSTRFEHGCQQIVIAREYSEADKARLIGVAGLRL